MTLPTWMQDPALRARAGAVAFWGLVALVMAWCFPYFAILQHANEQPRMFQALAMVEERSLAIDTYRQAFGYQKAMDLSRSFCLAPRVVAAARRGAPGPAPASPCVEKTYPNKAPGMSVLAVPVVAAVKLVWRAQGKPASVKALRDPAERAARLRVLTRWVRLGTATLPAFLFLLLLSFWLTPYVPEAPVRRLAVVAYGLGTLAFTYSAQVMSHQLGTALCFAAFIAVSRVARQAAPRAWLVVAGLLGGCAIASDYQLALAVVALGVYGLLVIRPWPALGLPLVGAVLPLGLLLWYHHACFGSALWTGYEFLLDRTDAELHAKGFLGMTRFSEAAFRSSFLSADNGLLYLSPWLGVALLGLPLVWRLGTGLRGWRPSAEAVHAILLVGLYVVFISSLTFWRGGWQTGPRYVAAMLPALVLPYALLLRRVQDRPLLFGLAAGPAFVGIALFAATVATYPHWPEKFQHPVFDLVGDLLGTGHVAYNLGQSWLGLSGLRSLLPYGLALGLIVLALAWGPWDAPERARTSARRALGVVLALCVAALILGQYQAAAQRNLRLETWLETAPRIGPMPREPYPAFLRRARGFIRQHWEPKIRR